MARSSTPVMRAAVQASVIDRDAPSAMLPGNIVAGGPTRTTEPCSWSIEVITGIAGVPAAAACWTALPKSASARGVVTLALK